MADMPEGAIPDEAFRRMVELAPPRFFDAAASIVADALPTPTHCDDGGRPVFSAEQIAAHFGKTPEDVHADIERLGLGDRMHTGPVHALQ